MALMQPSWNSNPIDLLDSSETESMPSSLIGTRLRSMLRQPQIGRDAAGSISASGAGHARNGVGRRSVTGQCSRSDRAGQTCQAAPGTHVAPAIAAL